MINIVINPIIIFLMATSLLACGLADPGDPPADDSDITAPQVEAIYPADFVANNLTITDQIDQITLLLNEPINKAALETLNKVEIRSNKGYQLNGTWSFNDSTNELIFTLDRSTEDGGTIPIPNGHKFEIKIDGEITDLAGNEFIYTLFIASPGLINVNANVTGLAPDTNLELKTSTGLTKILDKNNTLTSLPTNLDQNEFFTLQIVKQPEDGSFCTLSNATGIARSNTSKVDIHCSKNIIPMYSNTQYWNDHTQVSDTKPKVHSGMLRQIPLLNINSCENISAKDTENAFKWNCKVVSDDDTTHAVVYNTTLKQNAGLATLIDFSSTLKWKALGVNITQNGATVGPTDKYILWNNPILTAPQSARLTNENTIYVVRNDINNTAQNYEFNANGIALVIEPGAELRALANDTAGIWIKKSNSWLEGNIDSRRSQTGVLLKPDASNNSISFVTLRNAKIHNAEGNGIEISNTFATKLEHVSSINNSKNGIRIDKNVVSGVGTILNNVITSYNSKSGLSINSSHNRVTNLISMSNFENGVIVNQHNNIFNQINISNNTIDGIKIAGSQNNIINQATISSNGGNGISFYKPNAVNTPQNNFISFATLANNVSSGISFSSDLSQTIINSNSFIEVLDAFNDTSTCGDNDCSTTKLANQNDEITLYFPAVEADSIHTNFSPNRLDGIIKAGKVSKFQNAYRAWGRTTLGAGSCAELGPDIFCKIWDWTLNNNDNNIAYDALALPDTTQSYQQNGADSAVNYLSNSIELINDNIGNDNGLCEENESCLYTPNIGSYQGHGTNVPSVELTGEFWGNLGITLMSFETNGL